MTLAEFAQQVVAEQAPRACYIAIIDIDLRYDLEVEISEGTIGGVYQTEGALEEARRLADVLETELVARGVLVFHARPQWDAYLATLV